MKHPILYRKRLIPKECILLKDDIILSCDDTCLITKWNALKPRKDLHHGYSGYFLKEGFKISKFYYEDGSLRYWYCDIVEYHYDEPANKLTTTDLLVDVVFYPDGTVKVLDLEELADAFASELITKEQLCTALRLVDKLLKLIYSGEFKWYQDAIELYSSAKAQIADLNGKGSCV